MTLVLTLVACDSEARAEADALREQLDSQRVTLTAMQSQVAALTAQLAARPGPQVHDGLPPADPIADAAPANSPLDPAQAPSPITCVATRCTIAREAFDKLVNDPLALAKSARLIPSVKDGQTVGFKLYGIRPNSPFTVLDLKNGDLMTEVAGHPLSTMESALMAYGQLKTLDEWKIKGIRDGAAFERTIAVQK